MQADGERSAVGQARRRAVGFGKRRALDRDSSVILRASRGSEQRGCLPRFPMTLWSVALPISLMGSKLYVGNLNFTTTEEVLRAAFAANGGTVQEVAIPTDRETWPSPRLRVRDDGVRCRSRAAIAAMDDKDLDGRSVKVNEATARPSLPGGGNRGPGGGGGRRRDR